MQRRSDARRLVRPRLRARLRHEPRQRQREQQEQHAGEDERRPRIAIGACDEQHRERQREHVAEVAEPRAEPRDRAVGAGVGETVIITKGSQARYAAGRSEAPIDATIVGIVDSVEIAKD